VPGAGAPHCQNPEEGGRRHSRAVRRAEAIAAAGGGSRGAALTRWRGGAASVPCLTITLGPSDLESMPPLQCRAAACALRSRVNAVVALMESIWAEVLIFFCRISGWVTAHPVAPPLILLIMYHHTNTRWTLLHNPCGCWSASSFSLSQPGIESRWPL
jgi:hypothetical protein